MLVCKLYAFLTSASHNGDPTSYNNDMYDWNTSDPINGHYNDSNTMGATGNQAIMHSFDPLCPQRPPAVSQRPSADCHAMNDLLNGDLGNQATSSAQFGARGNVGSDDIYVQVLPDAPELPGSNVQSGKHNTDCEF
jgi:hypothetical protein